MFNPSSTITVTDWMLQSVNKSTSKQRAVALTAKGNEHKHEYFGTRNTESAEFTLGGAYSGNMTLPSLGSGITDFTVTYDEKEFPKLSVNKDSAAGGGTFALPFNLPARTIGIPAAIADLYESVTGCKQVTIAVSCQHVEETNGSGAYDNTNYSGMRDATVTVTFTGIKGKPTVVIDDDNYVWAEDSNAENDSNSAIGGGSVVYVAHFPIGTDTDAENQPASS